MMKDFSMKRVRKQKETRRKPIRDTESERKITPDYFFALELFYRQFEKKAVIHQTQGQKMFGKQTNFKRNKFLWILQE